jgi:hypothetical protein
MHEDVGQKTHEVVCTNTSMRSEQIQLKLLEDTMIVLKGHISIFNQQLLVLGQGVRSLLGDSLLAAAMVVYTGTLAWREKLELVEMWMAILAEGDVAHSTNFSLCKYMESTERQHVLLPRQVLLDESMQTSLYLAALVRPYFQCVHTSSDDVHACLNV